MIKVVLFDLDDTLISEDEYIRSGYRHIAEVLEEKYRLKNQAAVQELYRLYKESAKNVFNRFLDVHGIHYEVDDIKYLVNEYRSHTPHISYYDDVPETVQKLKDKGVRVGVITDGYLITQKKKAEAIQLQTMFEKIIFTDELGRDYWKPSTKSFEMMKKYFGVEYREMAYVGDNPQKDFYVKKSLPIKTIRIVRPISVYSDSDYLEGVKEDVRIENLSAILHAI